MEITKNSSVKFASLESLHITEYVQVKSSINASTIKPTELAVKLIAEVVSEIKWQVEGVGKKIVLNSLEFRKKLAEIKESCQCWNTKAFLTKVIRFFNDNDFIVRPEYLQVV